MKFAAAGVSVSRATIPASQATASDYATVPHQTFGACIQPCVIAKLRATEEAEKAAASQEARNGDVLCEAGVEPILYVMCSKIEVINPDSRRTEATDVWAAR